MNRLKQSLQMKGHIFKNRLVRSATWENMADSDGRPQPRLIDQYRVISESGVSLIVTGCAYILRGHQPNSGMMGIYDDSFRQEYQRIVNTAHKNDCRIIIQLDNGSSQTRFKPSRVIWGPSAVPEKSTSIVPKSMTSEDIQSLTQGFVNASIRACIYGFDGVQLHCAHGYALSQFLSPYSNQRQDQYGGNIMNRSRIICEISKAIREKVSDNFIIAVKINSEDFVEGGLNQEDSLAACILLEKAGIDIIEVSGGIWASGDLYARRPRHMASENEAYFLPYSQILAENVSCPVILTGGIRNPEIADKILESTKISFIGLSRPLLREPGLPLQWLNGSTTKSRCISCNQCFSTNGNTCRFQRTC